MKEWDARGVASGYKENPTARRRDLEQCEFFVMRERGKGTHSKRKDMHSNR